MITKLVRKLLTFSNIKNQYIMKALKTTLLVGLTVFTFSNCNAQWGKKIKGNGNVTTITRSTSDYDQIKLAGSMDFKLVEGQEGKITLKGESNLLDYIITETDGDQLTIKFKNNVNIAYGRKKIEITIPYREISYVSLAGSGAVTNNSTIKAKRFTTKLSGSGDIALNIESNSTEVTVTGSGDLKLVGNTNKLKATVTGSGDFHGKKLASTNADLKVTGSGTIDAMVKDNLKAKVTGSGDINYYGNPKDTDNKVVGSGDISKM